MSLKYLSNIDLSGNQLLNPVAQQLGTDPGSPNTGGWWFNTTSNVMRYYNGATTVTLYDSATANTASKLVLRDGSGNFAANVVTAAGVTITGTPSAGTDAATKGYVDSVAQGLSPKPSATCATAGALAAYTYANGASGVGATITFNAAGTQAVDGHTLALGDVVLVKDEAGGNLPYNGLYTVSTAPAAGVAGVLTRSVYLNTPAEFLGAYLLVESGTANAKTGWIYTGAASPTLGTTNVTFGQFTGAGDLTFNAPLSASGNAVSVGLSARVVNAGGNLDLASGVATAATYYGQFTVDTYGRVTAGADLVSANGIVAKTTAGTFTARTVTGTANQIAVANGDGVAGNPTLSISAGYAGQASITTLGTVGTGAWQGTAVGVAYGGTGATSASAARANLGAAGLYTGTVTGDGSTTQFTVTHNLGNINPVVGVRDSSNNQVLVDNQGTGANTLKVTFAVAPANAVVYNVTAVG